MIVISTRDFRTNQSKYLNLVKSGEHIVLKSRSGSFKITPVSEEDAVVNKRDLADDLRKALVEVKESILNEKPLQSFDSLIDEL